MFDFLANPDFWIAVAVAAASLGVFALGLQLSVGTTGILNFGQAGFMALGAYTMGILVVKTGASFWIAVGVGIAVAVAAACAVALVGLRLRADYFAIATLAFAEIVRYLTIHFDELTEGNRGLIGYNGNWNKLADWLTLRLEDVGVAPRFLLPLAIVGWTIFLVLALAVWLLTRTPWGRVCRAIRDDEDLARALGKNTFVVKTQALSISAALAAIAGYLLALDLAILSPDAFDSVFTVFGFTIIILGGLGSYLGVVVGTGILLVLLESTRFLDLPLADDKVAGIRYIIVGMVLIGLIAFRPQGLFGQVSNVGNR